jgi:hypothetical protein
MDIGCKLFCRVSGHLGYPGLKKATGKLLRFMYHQYFEQSEPHFPQAAFVKSPLFGSLYLPTPCPGGTFFDVPPVRKQQRFVDRYPDKGGSRLFRPGQARYKDWLHLNRYNECMSLS